MCKQICCPNIPTNEDIDEIEDFDEIRVCTDDELYDYYNGDVEQLDCQTDDPPFLYIYNDDSHCPSGTTCTNGNNCGVTGNIDNLDTF